MKTFGVALASAAEAAAATRDDQPAVVWAGFGTSVRLVERRCVRLALDLHGGPMPEHVGRWLGDVRVADRRGYEADSFRGLAAGVVR
jgi:hypothetical protein